MYMDIASTGFAGFFRHTAANSRTSSCCARSRILSAKTRLRRLPAWEGSLELEECPVELSPPGGVHCHRAQAEERRAALQEGLAVGVGIAAFVNVEEDHADPQDE